MGNLVLESITAGSDVGAIMYNVTCSTPASTAAKIATAATEFALIAGVRVRVTFTDGNTAANPTLSINSTTAVPLMLDANTSVVSWNAGAVIDLIYAGGAYFVSGGGVLGALSTPTVGKGVNLLDNWYFPNPVNQRGINSISNQGYYVDRWFAQGSPSYTVAQGEGVKWSVTSGVIASFAQAIEMDSAISGKTVTLSWLIDGQLYSKSVTLPASPTASTYPMYESALFGHFGIGYEYTINGNLKWIAFINATDGTPGTYTIQAVKLELGSQQTLARNIGTAANPNWVLNDPPPNYQQELAKCQRYYFNSGSQANDAFVGSSPSGNFIFANVRFPVPMRKIPDTITIKDYAGTSGCVSNWDGSTNGISGWINNITLGIYGFNAIGGTFTAGYVYAFHVEASAEL